MNVTPSSCAKNVLSSLGIEDTASVDIEDLIVFYDGIVKHAPMTNCDGRVVMKNGKSIVTLNSTIEFPQKKRFVLSHELGHILLHANKDATFSDDYFTLEAYKHGIQEKEANDFASELLMPTEAFSAACQRQKFGGSLIRSLAQRFNTSITSTVYRYIDLGPHPICVFYSVNGIVQYWKKSQNFNYWLKDRNRLRVPEDSVAQEFYGKNKIYHINDSDQVIYKSTWCELGALETDSQMFEFCVIVPHYNTVLSVIWAK
jgi:Zn-dependent peptidase ImmA (M78 family)